MITVRLRMTEATRTLQPLLRSGNFVVVDAGVSGWFHLYLVAEGDKEVGIDLTQVNPWATLDSDEQQTIEMLLDTSLKDIQQLAADATHRLTHLGFKGMVIETYVCDDAAWGEYNKQGTAAGRAFYKTHGIGVKASSLQGEDGLDTLIHEWAHWYMRQMPKAEEARIDTWFKQHVQSQIDTKIPAQPDDIRHWVELAIRGSFVYRFHMPFENFLEIADRVWDYKDEITDSTIPPDLLSEVGFTHWQNLASEGLEVVGKFKKSLPLDTSDPTAKARKGAWGYVLGHDTYMIVVGPPNLTKNVGYWCVNPKTGKETFTAEEVEDVFAIDLEKTAQFYDKKKRDTAHPVEQNLTIAPSRVIYNVLRYLQAGGGETLAEGVWGNKKLVMDSIFNDLLNILDTGKDFRLLPNGVQIWEDSIHDLYLQLIKDGDTVDRVVDAFTLYAAPCFTEAEQGAKKRAVQAGVAPSLYGTTNSHEFFAVLIAKAARGVTLSPQMSQWLRDFIRGDFKESHKTKELDMDQPKIETLTEALTFDKRVMRELSRKDSLVRMFAKDQPLDILFTTLVVGDSGLESKYIEIAKSLGADVGVKESVDSLPQKWEISFCNLTEQHIARMGQQIHTENTNDIPHMTLPGSAVPIPISALHVDREAGKVSFRIHTVSERIARLVMDEMQKVLDGKTE